MQTLIYQCWTGPMRKGVLASMANMQAYAERIGAQYRFDKDPDIAGKVCDVKAYFEWLNPMLDSSFDGYDKILAVDMDVFTVDGLTENIFDVPIADVGICTEPFQPEHRASIADAHICGKRDEEWAAVIKRRWNIDLPRTAKGLLKVYNAGVVVFTAAGLAKMRQRFVPFQTYVNAMRAEKLKRFYTVDQNYFHAMMVGHLDYTEMDNDWNSYVHYLGSPQDKPRSVHDSRTANTKMVHIQLRGADDWDAATLARITNQPVGEKIRRGLFVAKGG